MTTLRIMAIAVGAIVMNSANADEGGKVKITPVEVVAPRPLPITGSVSITGAPEVRISTSTPIPVIGQFIPSGIQQVQVVNSSPLPVEIAGRQVYRERLEIPWQSQTAGTTFFAETAALPAGFRVEVHSIMCTVFLPAPAAGAVAFEMQSTTAGGPRHFFLPERVTLGGGFFASLEKKILIHRRNVSGTSENLRFVVRREPNGADVFIPAECTLSGYYVADNS